MNYKIEAKKMLFSQYNTEFENVDILKITATKNCNFVFLKNGTILSWSDNLDSLGRKCKKSGEDCLYPLPIEIENKLKILDIVCGNNHCLVKTTNFQIYAWGSNLYGQVKINYKIHSYNHLIGN